MGRVIGYGEDGLTLWACTQRLPVVLKALDDTTAPGDCLFFYRPSFGRKGGQKNAQFGEFDGILATRRCVYPIESKWFRSPRRERLVKLKPHQVLRHEILQWLRERWQPGMKWPDFSRAFQAEFANAFQNKPLAPVRSKLSDLADNSEHILDMLASYPRKIEHVVLAFYREASHAPLGVASYKPPFRLVGVAYDPINPGGLFCMMP